jgi:hypothetical protein
MNDGCWNTVDWGNDFIQTQPEENKPPSQKTAFKILYDDNNLYVFIRAYDTEPEKISRIMSRRDNFDGDMVEINIDSYYDKQTAFSFTATAAGVKGDEAITQNGNNWDPSWNPICNIFGRSGMVRRDENSIQSAAFWKKRRTGVGYAIYETYLSS